jgi:hypothetical protein
MLEIVSKQHEKLRYCNLQNALITPGNIHHAFYVVFLHPYNLAFTIFVILKY